MRQEYTVKVLKNCYTGLQDMGSNSTVP